VARWAPPSQLLYCTVTSKTSKAARCEAGVYQSSCLVADVSRYLQALLILGTRCCLLCSSVAVTLFVCCDLFVLSCVLHCSKDCEVLADKLCSAGVTAAYYHADLEPAARSASHTAWSSGNVKVGLILTYLHGSRTTQAAAGKRLGGSSADGARIQPEWPHRNPATYTSIQAADCLLLVQPSPGTVTMEGSVVSCRLA